MKFLTCLPYANKVNIRCLSIMYNLWFFKNNLITLISSIKFPIAGNKI